MQKIIFRERQSEEIKNVKSEIWFNNKVNNKTGWKCSKERCKMKEKMG